MQSGLANLKNQVDPYNSTLGRQRISADPRSALNWVSFSTMLQPDELCNQAAFSDGNLYINQIVVQILASFIVCYPI